MILYLDSNTATNNDFKLDRPVTGKFKLLSFTCTNNIQNVNEYNNIVYITENSVDYQIELPTGYYDIYDLKSMLEDEIGSMLMGTFSVDLDEQTRKYTFSNTIPFYFKFSTNTSKSARKLLGINAVDTSSSTSYTSDVPVDVNTYKNIFINILQHDDRNIRSINHFTTSFIINGSASFGETLRYINQDNFDQYAKFEKTKTLTIRFHDINYNPIDLNSDYQIILQR